MLISSPVLSHLFLLDPYLGLMDLLLILRILLLTQQELTEQKQNQNKKPKKKPQTKKSQNPTNQKNFPQNKTEFK